MSQEEKPITAGKCNDAPAVYRFRPEQWQRIADLGGWPEPPIEPEDGGIAEPVRRHRFSVSEYEALGEAGIIPYDARVELIDGEIIAMSPIGYRHAQTTSRLTEFFIRRSHGRFKVRTQCPIRLEEQEPQPDVVLIRPVAALEPRHPVATDIFLLIEVADSSLEFDRETKLAEYARHAVPEVWIVNLRLNVFEVFRRPVTGAYAEKLIIPCGGVLAPEAFPDLDLSVSKNIP